MVFIDLFTSIFAELLKWSLFTGFQSVDMKTAQLLEGVFVVRQIIVTETCECLLLFVFTNVKYFVHY
jgi:hypothetical protein